MVVRKSQQKHIFVFALRIDFIIRSNYYIKSFQNYLKTISPIAIHDVLSISVHFYIYCNQDKKLVQCRGQFNVVQSCCKEKEQMTGWSNKSQKFAADELFPFVLHLLRKLKFNKA